MTQSGNDTNDGTHRCPGTGCQQRVPHHQLACKRHWYKVPKVYRDAVWRAYENDGMGSPAHRAAIRAAIGAMNGEH